MKTRQIERLTASKSGDTTAQKWLNPLRFAFESRAVSQHDVSGGEWAAPERCMKRERLEMEIKIQHFTFI